jgi:soluble lytic murein transglycosylase-like protein
MARLGACFFILMALAQAPEVRAGAQREEALADSVRLALSRAVSDPRPPALPFTSPAEQAAWFRWFETMSKRLQSRMPDAMVRTEFLQTLWYEAHRAGLDPSLVLGLIQVESGFRKYAISSAGARGYMQVMPFWSRVIGDGQPSHLFHMQTNLRYGCSILRLYLDAERGDLFLALGRYNGSRGKSEYPNAVRAAWKRWEH